MPSSNERNVDADFSTKEKSRIADNSASEREMDAAQGNSTRKIKQDPPSIDPPTLPSGNVIDAKNTLQSFDFQPRSNRASAVGVVRYTNNSNAQAPVNQPTLPSGQVIDFKNTMQSHDTAFGKVPHVPTTSLLGLTNAPASLNQPTLPRGQVIDFKNTLQSHDLAFGMGSNLPATGLLSNSGDAAAQNIISTETKRQTEASSSIDSARERSTDNLDAFPVEAFAVEDVSAGAIVEGELFTESPRPDRTIWWVIGSLTIMVAIVVTGVCAAGQCSAKSDAPILKIPTSSPTLLPTPSPTIPPVDVQIEKSVFAFINNISYVGEDIPVNGTTPESRALMWLVDEDKLFADNRSELLLLNAETDTEASFRIRQRYALRTLWYQQYYDNGTLAYPWVETQGWEDDPDECSWYGIACIMGDLERYVVRQIDFYNDNERRGNNYFGTMPPDIGLLTSLNFLDFNSNRVMGILPESIAQCSLLEIFDMSGCSLSGTFSSSIGKLTDMAYFDIAANQIFGTIPFNFQFWFKLSYFNAENNDLTGAFPEYIESWSSLTRLDVSGNKLTGTIPEQIGLLTNLTYFDISINQMNGTLPSSIGELTRLTHAGFTNNKLEGTIPNSVGNWSPIVFAFFTSNEFTGSVPDELCVNNTTMIYDDCDFPCAPGCCAFLTECPIT